MDHHALNDLLQQRLTQLKSISDRRNDLLREMYLMMRRRDNTGQILALADQHEEQDLHLFLQRFDISEHPEDGSIVNLRENELFSSQRSRSSSIISPEINAATVAETHSRSRSSEQDPTNKHPSPPAATPKKVSLILHATPSRPYLRHVPEDESEDELDMFGSYHRQQASQQSDGPANEAAPTSHEVIDLIDDDLADGEGDLDDDGEESDDEVIQLSSDNVPPSSSPLISDGRLADQEVPPNEADIDDQMAVDHGGFAEEIRIPDQTGDGELIYSPKPMPGRGTTPSMIESDDEMDIESVSSNKASEENFTHSEPFRQKPCPIQHTLPNFPSKAPRPIFILTPEAPLQAYDYSFDPEDATRIDQGRTILAPPTLLRSGPHTKYSLPPLKSLPAEYNRKNKSKQRKRDREKEKNDPKREAYKDDWTPMGLNRWAATINANPVWKRVARATKCLSSREWAVAMVELRLARSVDRIEALKDAGRWSFRQPKRQRGVGGLVKSHWDYLMDEMKWMRIDFREERKWKMALAYNLSTSVLEWHAAGSWSERFAQGIAVRWKRHLPTAKVGPGDIQAEYSTPMDRHQPCEHTPTSLLALDYGSEEEDEDEQDQEVIDVLQPSAILEEAFETERSDLGMEGSSMVPNLKKEELEDQHSLGHLEPLGIPTVDTLRSDIISVNNDHVPSGLKPASQDVILGFNPEVPTGEDEISFVPTKTSLKASVYTHIRERVAHSNDQQLFLSLADLCLDESPLAHAANDTVEHVPSPADLSTIFPDLQPLGLLDVAPNSTPNSSESRKKSDKRNDKDDPNRRAEDVTYSKLHPASRFMRSKPTLLGPLLPSKKWKDGSWSPIEEMPIVPERDGLAMRIAEDNSLNELFENRTNNTAAAFWQAAALKDTRRRSSDHIWTQNDDALLKSCIDKYPYNWYLIAECFNASRVTISTDKRSARDCLDRWREKWGSDLKLRQQDVSVIPSEGTPQPSSSQTQMTTRGVKRMATGSVTSPTVGIASSGPEPRKRRRHMLMQETIRKYTKKRIEALQKANTQRKPSAIHETHGQYAKMQKYSPAELIRLKAERDAREQQEMLARKRHVEELGRQVIQARLSQQQQQQQQQPTPSSQQQSPHQQQAATAAQGLPGSNAVPPVARPAGMAMPAQMRVTQVNISQQQRLAAAIAQANARLSPQQQMQMQGQQGGSGKGGGYYLGGLSAEQMSRVMVNGWKSVCD